MRGRQPRDRGSVSIWLVIFTFTAIVLLGLVVDGGQVMIAKSRAADIAEQAARAAADDIDPVALRAGHVALAPGFCDQAGPAAALIATYSKGVGVTASMGDCEPVTDVQGDPGVTVQVHVSVNPVIPSPAFSAITVSVSETAFLACGTADARVRC